MVVGVERILKTMIILIICSSQFNAQKSIDKESCY